MIYKVEFSWESRDKLVKMPAEDYQKLRKDVICLPEEQGGYFYGDYVIDAEAIEKLIGAGIEVNVKQIKNTYSPQKTEAPWVKNLDTAKNAVHIHVPNIGLLMINEVMVLEDSCTDILQQHLNENWRILAVCPPNGTRRPDYVLGRTKGE